MLTADEVRMTSIIERLNAATCQTRNGSLCDWPILIQYEPEMNAYFAPFMLDAIGNIPAYAILINKGILDIAGDEDEVAFIVAHELAHGLLGHGGQGGSPFFSRMQDDADCLGIEIMERAGYNPRASIRILKHIGGNTRRRYRLLLKIMELGPVDCGLEVDYAR